MNRPNDFKENTFSSAVQVFLNPAFAGMSMQTLTAGQNPAILINSQKRISTISFKMMKSI